VGNRHLQLNSNFLLSQLCCAVPLEVRWVFTAHRWCCGRGKLPRSQPRQLEPVAKARFWRVRLSVVRLALLTLSRPRPASLRSRRHQSTALALVCTLQSHVSRRRTVIAALALRNISFHLFSRVDDASLTSRRLEKSLSSRGASHVKEASAQRFAANQRASYRCRWDGCSE
jgi:hypothetical protein